MPGRKFFQKNLQYWQKYLPGMHRYMQFAGKKEKPASVSKRKWSYQPPFLSVDTTIHFLYQYVWILKA